MHTQRTHMHTQAHMSMHGMLQSTKDLNRHLGSQPCWLSVYIYSSSNRIDLFSMLLLPITHQLAPWWVRPSHSTALSLTPHCYRCISSSVGFLQYNLDLVRNIWYFFLVLPCVENDTQPGGHTVIIKSHHYHIQARPVLLITFPTFMCCSFIIYMLALVALQCLLHHIVHTWATTLPTSIKDIFTCTFLLLNRQFPELSNNI